MDKREPKKRISGQRSAIRTVPLGTILGAEITRKFGDSALKDDTYVVECEGAGGQSFGAFIPKGLTLRAGGRFQ